MPRGNRERCYIRSRAAQSVAVKQAPNCSKSRIEQRACRQSAARFISRENKAHPCGRPRFVSKTGVRERTLEHIDNRGLDSDEFLRGSAKREQTRKARERS